MNQSEDGLSCLPLGKYNAPITSQVSIIIVNYYVGSTTTKFRLRLNNHKSRIRRHEMLGQAEKGADDLLYRHFCSEGHSGLTDVRIQLIDRVNGEEQLREKEGQWAYRLQTLDPSGLNDNDFFFVQNRRSRRT